MTLFRYNVVPLFRNPVTSRYRHIDMTTFRRFSQDLILQKPNCFILNNLEAKWSLKDLT